MKRVLSAGLGAVLCLTLLPRATAAQGTSAASIAGVVKDTSGAVLPGVTVEAASPALIEKVRATVTDDKGEYRIIELRPGTYSVTFTLAGFATLKRDGLELPANFTATVNTELRVGGLEETITVSGETPLVDVQNVTQQKVITQDVLDSVPSAKSQLALASLMPAATQAPSTQDVGGSRGEASSRISIHGGRPDDSLLLLDGMSYNRIAATNGRGAQINPLAASEILIDSGGGGSAEYISASASINMVPRDGGNKFSGTLFFSGMNDHFQGDNLTDNLKAQGLGFVGKLTNIYDANIFVGGPIRQDKLWFASSHRRWGRDEKIGNVYTDANADSRVYGAPASVWKYAPSTTPVQAREDQRADDIRLTWQAAQTHKVTFSYTWQHNNAADNFSTLNTGTFKLDAVTPWCHYDQITQTTWTHPATNKLLFEAGYSVLNESIDYHDNPCVGNPYRILINDTGFGYTYNGRGSVTTEHQINANGRASVAYVTGTHSYKVGMKILSGLVNGTTERLVPGGIPVQYRFSNGIPNQITVFGAPTVNSTGVDPNLGIFAQDSWRLNRLTVDYGVRYEYVRAHANAVNEPASLSTPGGASFPSVTCLPCWHDINPRLGLAYNLFGNGRTAIKFSIGRYVQLLNTGYTNFGPFGTSTVANITRSWTDTNDNFFPDCDLTNNQANGECRVASNLAFGQIVTRSAPDGDFLTGWGKRGYTWNTSVSVDHEISTGIAVNVGYYRTTFGNFTVTDNTLVAPADYDPYCFTAPADSRLPGNISGNQICGFYDLNPNGYQGTKPNLFGQVFNVTGLASKFGNYTEVYNGFDANFAMRLRHGINLAGGYNVGNAVNVFLTFPGSTQSNVNRCFVVDSPQELYNCKTANPYQGRFKLNGSVPLPWWGLQMGAVYQDLPGPNYTSLLTVPNSLTTLGRPFASGVSNVTIDLLQTLGYYVETRIHQLDLRASRSSSSVGRSA